MIRKGQVPQFGMHVFRRLIAKFHHQFGTYTLLSKCTHKHIWSTNTERHISDSKRTAIWFLFCISMQLNGHINKRILKYQSLQSILS